MYIIGLTRCLASQKELGRFDLAADRKDGLLKRLDVLKTTDMALIVSPSQNEIEQMRARGLDIVPHRKRMNTEALDEKFKDPEDPLRTVFLCAMWLTGFDAPSCSTVYLDRPMRNHTLMQTIARANRVFPGQTQWCDCGLRQRLRLARKGAGHLRCRQGGKTPVRDKKELVGTISFAFPRKSLSLRFVMKIRPSHPLVTFFLGCLLVLCLSAYAGTYSGKVSDLDAGNGYLTVTNPDNQTTQTFKVTSETIILTSDGKPSQLLDLIEGTRVAVDADPGTGKIAAKITVLADASAEPP